MLPLNDLVFTLSVGGRSGMLTALQEYEVPEDAPNNLPEGEDEGYPMLIYQFMHAQVSGNRLLFCSIGKCCQDSASQEVYRMRVANAGASCSESQRLICTTHEVRETSGSAAYNLT